MPGSDEPPFEYLPLCVAKQELRLIRLKATSDRIIECDVETFSLITAPRYTALSYMWGNPSRTISISANTKVLKITHNLEEFFRQLLSRQKHAQANHNWCAEWFWIDAICINQDDLRERSEQVMMMKQIYESARNIVIWLGSAPERGDEAMKLLFEIASLDTNGLNLKDGDISDKTCFLSDGKGSLIETSYDILAAVGTLFNGSYWDRAWIIQEASTPKSEDTEENMKGQTWVCCGDLTIAWKSYAKANRLLMQAAWSNKLREHVDLHDVANSNVATVGFLEERRRTEQMENPLYPTLVRTRTSEATDPRDKLYSVLGLVSERLDVGLRPDYTLSVVEVYTRLTKTMIQQGSSLDCLGSAGLVKEHPVPTWVPDWTIQHDEIPQPFYQYDQTWHRAGTVSLRKNIFTASGDTAMETHFPEPPYQLCAKGMFFDTIAAVSVPRHWPDHNTGETWANWVLIADPTDLAYADITSRHTAFEKVLKADFKEVRGDWSAVRGGIIEGYNGAAENVFDLHDGIVDAMTWNRRLFTSHKGYMGIAPSYCDVGDTVAILFGSQMPMVLRKHGTYSTFIGQAYVHGIMDGEAVAKVDIESCSEFFKIV